jgi:DEAD/DEAH box helicase domain-containing protein
MIESDGYQKKIVHQRTVPGREAVYSDFPSEMLPEIIRYLEEESHIKNLYCHQAEMFLRAEAGENVVITTSTASGKTLGFLLPILQEILKNPSARAIFLYPTKALASDQFRNIAPILKHFGEHKIQAGIYDGDTPVSERSRIRSSANIILTNPEMLNAAFLPHHSNFGFDFIFRNLKYIVIDELHTYRGAFGSHLANLFKRAGRVCGYYGSSPQYLCSSATIANPVELAQKICGKAFSLVDRDGSPAPEKKYYFWQPPTARGTEYRISPAREASDLIPLLTTQGSHFIAFCKSRNAVEVVLRESRDKLKSDGTGPDQSSLISGYRGGYKPLERREIEQKMADGRIRGLISTNVLELGIDIGSLDTAILVGFPGTRASFWQQSGRAGRKGNAAFIYLMLDNLPLDQYLAIDPDWLFSGGSESAVVAEDNLLIQIAHVRAAAAELPISPDDIAVFPDLGEIVPVLLAEGQLKKADGKFMWSGAAYPAGDYSLRNMDKVQYKLKNTADNSILTEMDELQAYREIYAGAIYMHEGLQYLVESLDIHDHTAQAKPVDVNYYTIPHDTTEVQKIMCRDFQALGRTNKHFGNVQVNYTTSGFKRLQFHDHQNLGFDKLDHPLSKTFDTEGFWIRIPRDVSNLFLRLTPQKEYDTPLRYWKTYFEGLGFVLLNAAMMLTMTTQDDIGSALLAGDTAADTSICIFDMYAGGLGFAEKAYGSAQSILENAIRMVEGCPCGDGCSACVGDYHLDKKIVLWGLKSIFEELKAPVEIKAPKETPAVRLIKRFDLQTLPERWQEFTAFIRSLNGYLCSFLADAVIAAKVRGNTLVLLLDNPFYMDWISEKTNREQLYNIIKQYVSGSFEIEFACIPPDECES